MEFGLALWGVGNAQVRHNTWRGVQKGSVQVDLGGGYRRGVHRCATTLGGGCRRAAYKWTYYRMQVCHNTWRGVQKGSIAIQVDFGG